LVITFGFQFFLLVGYLFYFLFRKWVVVDDQIVLLSWVAGFLGLLTIGLLLIVAIILPRMVIAEAIFASAIVALDLIGLYLLVKETWNRKMTIEHGFLDEET
ncbi:MAG: hypothetical protein ACFFE6_15660, partial [Candidatus Thorarchaeota archaeon]